MKRERGKLKDETEVHKSHMIKELLNFLKKCILYPGSNGKPWKTFGKRKMRHFWLITYGCHVENGLEKGGGKSGAGRLVGKLLSDTEKG